VKGEVAPPADYAARRVRVHQVGDRVLVWQAHGPELARDCLALGRLGGPRWSLTRHTRFRLSLPSLLARTERGAKPGREHTLGVWLPRKELVSLLRQAVHNCCEMAVYGSLKSWRLASRWSQVSIEWHHDVDLAGAATGWATPRIRVRQQALVAFTDGVAGLEDWTERVRAGETPPPLTELELPAELAARLSGEG